jgi:hypothetical protein
MVDSYLDSNLQFNLTNDILNLIDEDIKMLAQRNEVLKQKNTELANK